jgi:hypothetical protein
MTSFLLASCSMSSSSRESYLSASQRARRTHSSSFSTSFSARRAFLSPGECWCHFVPGAGCRAPPEVLISSLRVFLVAQVLVFQDDHLEFGIPSGMPTGGRCHLLGYVRVIPDTPVMTFPFFLAGAIPNFLSHTCPHGRCQLLVVTKTNNKGGALEPHEKVQKSY